MFYANTFFFFNAVSSRRGLSFLCAYTCSSRRWVQASGGTKGPLEDDNPAFSALKDLLRLVCGQASGEERGWDVCTDAPEINSCMAVSSMMSQMQCSCTSSSHPLVATVAAPSTLFSSSIDVCHLSTIVLSIKIVVHKECVFSRGCCGSETASNHHARLLSWRRQTILFLILRWIRTAEEAREVFHFFLFFTQEVFVFFRVV